MRILAAEYVLPIATEPIHQGGVVVEAQRIRAAGALDMLVAEFPGAAVTDFGHAALLPGFVNCHSHLEITAMRGLLDSVEHDFFDWLITLTKARAGLSDEEIKIAALAGAVEGAAAGVTCFGDIGRFGDAGLYALRTCGLRGVVFQETEFSPDDAAAQSDFEKLKEKYEALAESRTSIVEIGISPHATYTVSRKLFELIGAYAREQNIKLSIHAAESKEEDELLRKGTGFFAGVYSKFNAAWKSPMCSPIEFLESTGILSNRPVLAHCVTATDSDIELLKMAKAAIAHCPKSNAKFGHGFAAFESFLDHDIAVGFGSDSVASNNSCDMLEEARFGVLAARNRPSRHRFISSSEALKATTLGGARALGLDHLVGSLEVGKQADITAISLDHVGQLPVNNVEHALVFSSSSRDVRMTMVAGEEIYRNGHFITIDQSEMKTGLASIAAKLSNLA